MSVTELATLQKQRAPLWTGFAFASGTLLGGMLVAIASFTSAVTASQLKHPPLWPPPWVFWAVWIVIYPCMGVATWLVWQQRSQIDVRGPLVYAIQSYVAGLFFLPIASRTGGNPAVMTLMDANGVISSFLWVWLFTRYTRASLWWLLPLLIWMPITLALKIWLWILNP